MYRVYNITYTTDSNKTTKRIAVPAESIPSAYVELQLKVPNAEILAIDTAGKTIIIKEGV